MALVAAQAFNAAGLGYQARTVIENALVADWDPRLAEEYARSGDQTVNALFAATGALRAKAGADDPRPQIERAERWTREHPDDASAFYALGALCAREKLWGKALKALNSALELAPDARLLTALNVELGRVYEQIEDPDKSREHFRAAALANVGR